MLEARTAHKAQHAGRLEVVLAASLARTEVGQAQVLVAVAVRAWAGEAQVGQAAREHEALRRRHHSLRSHLEERRSLNIEVTLLLWSSERLQSLVRLAWAQWCAALGDVSMEVNNAELSRN